MLRPRTMLTLVASFSLLICSGCDFEDFDQDGDGLITVDEFVTAACTLFCPPDETPPEEPPAEEQPPAADPTEVQPLS